MRRVGAFVAGFVVGRWALLLVLIVIGLIIAGAQSPSHYPVPAQQATEARRADEVRMQSEEEAARQVEYRKLGIPPASEYPEGPPVH